MSLPAYKPPALCTKAKVAKGGGVFAGHYGTMDWTSSRLESEQVGLFFLDNLLTVLCYKVHLA